ncbi:hypothetical protein DRO02_06300 [archaeon]|nr:MAG: hypothetical protein DRO02_06300 [archaeon]
MSEALRKLKMELKGPLSLILLAVTGILITLPLLVRNPFLINTLMLSFLFGFAALAWNLMAGYTGLLSFGHAVFFGIGAYTTMILLLWWRITPWIGMLAAGVTAGLVGFVIGIPFTRLRSHWFALGTLALGEVVQIIFINWRAVGGARGLETPIMPQCLYWLNFVDPTVHYYVIMGLLGVELFILYLIVNGRIGYYLQAIREDETAAMALGINPFKYKLISITISAFLTGIAGGFYTARFGYVDPFSVFGMMYISINISIIGILGGIYSLIGPLIGALVFVPAAEYTRAYIGSHFGARFYGIHLVAFGIILLAVCFIVPDGIMGWVERRGYIRAILGHGEEGVGGGE